MPYQTFSQGYKCVCYPLCLFIRKLTSEVRRANYFNYINMTDSDNSDMMRFLTDELQDAEDAGERGQLSSILPACWGNEVQRSLALGPRSQRLGWNKPLAKPDKPL
jgi:hypothetical protein